MFTEEEHSKIVTFLMEALMREKNMSPFPARHLSSVLAGVLESPREADTVVTDLQEMCAAAQQWEDDWPARAAEVLAIVLAAHEADEQMWLLDKLSPAEVFDYFELPADAPN